MPFFTFSPIIHITLGFAVVGIITATGFYVLSRIRASSLQKEPPPVEFLQKFREMNSEGGLDDDEFRIIKRQLSEKVIAGSAPKEKRPVFHEAPAPLGEETPPPARDTSLIDVSGEETKELL